MMRVLRLPKPQTILLGAVLLAVAWLGYWIGHVTSQGNGLPEVIQQQGAIHAVQTQQRNNRIKYLTGNKGLNLPKGVPKNVPRTTHKVVQNFQNQNSQPVLQIPDESNLSQKANSIKTNITKRPTKPVPVVKTTPSVRYNQSVQQDLRHNAKDEKKPLVEPKVEMVLNDTQKRINIKAPPQKLQQPVISQNLTLGKAPLPEVPNQGASLKRVLPTKPGVLGGIPNPDYYYLLHGGHATKIHGKIHENLKSLPDYIPKTQYIFTSDSLPSDPRMRPSIANGHLGTAVHSQEVFMNGLYNGRGSESHRAVIPSTSSVNVTDTQPPSNYTRTYSLNVAEGIYSEFTNSSAYNITQRMYAHRTLNRLLVVEIDLMRREVSTPLQLNVKLNKWTTSFDLTFHRGQTDIPETSYKIGRANAAERPEMEEPTEVHVLYDHIPDSLVPPPVAYRTKWVFLTAIAPTQQEAFDAYHLGSKLVKSNDQLYAQHVEAWSHLWANGSIVVVGNERLSRAVYGSLYYILSSMPVKPDLTWPYIGLSPTGLPFGNTEDDYLGHVFWDQETWMYPSILMLYPELARILLETRNRTRVAAAENAKHNGKKGYQYPWESAASGYETCPDIEIAEREIHITGDISQAVLQYLRATGEGHILDQGYLDMLAGIANYWVSRLTFNQQLNMYTILGVIPPDEYQKNVSNSVYTNCVARLAIEAPAAAQKLRGYLTQNLLDHWKPFFNIYIPFDKKLQYHPEFDGYKPGTKVKQADVILLGFPLQVNISDTVRRNDLTTYQKVTDVGGPAMSWTMFAINWLQLREAKLAEDFFNRNYDFIKNEFQVWHETSFGKGATNFLTGMGGFLQMLVFGYGGLSLQDNALQVHPQLPPDTQQLQILDFNYLGSSLNLFVEQDHYTIVLISKGDLAPNLALHLDKSETIHNLQINRPVVVTPIQPSSIQRSMFL